MAHDDLGLKGAVSAPHHLAAQAGRDVLAEGGDAVEAMVAMAATIAVVYPHMNAIGGDGFWLIRRPGRAPVAVMGAGRAAARATPAFYAERGHRDALPTRGPLAALTAPAAIAGWRAALATRDGREETRLPLSRLMADAVSHAEDGVPVTRQHCDITREKLDELIDVPGFADIFAPDGPPAPGAVLRQPALARTLQRLGDVGLDDFYAGEIAAAHAAYLERVGSPLAAADLAAVEAPIAEPVRLEFAGGTVFNTPPPTQGVASQMILGIFERVAAKLETSGPDSVDHIHALIEATKSAFLVRDAGLGDPDAMAAPAQSWLAPDRLDAMAQELDLRAATPWPRAALPGDTIWMGAADASGAVVSYIQSTYWEFGSGLACPETGVVFQNRGAGFSLAPGPNQLGPGKRPFHTLNPPLAELADGRVLAYGCMGGDGQPQTQAAIFTRHVHYGVPLAEAVAAPRWLLGRTWGVSETDLKLEADIDPALIEGLRARGHAISILPPRSPIVGHAGAVSIDEAGLFTAAGDPRSDGLALAL